MQHDRQPIAVVVPLEPALDFGCREPVHGMDETARRIVIDALSVAAQVRLIALVPLPPAAEARIAPVDTIVQAVVQVAEDVARLAGISFPAFDFGIGGERLEGAPGCAIGRKRAGLAVRQVDDALHGAPSSAISNARCRSRWAPCVRISWHLRRPTPGRGALCRIACRRWLWPGPD